MTKLGILHPGKMGISVAASAQNSGCDVYWASEGRSEQTAERATQYQLKDSGSLESLSDICTVLVSVCPPHAAEDVAQQVIEAGFRGIYSEANAIAPQRAQQIGQNMLAAGIRFVDGGIIGGPAWEPERTWLYLSGEDAQEVAACFSAGPLETEIIGSEIGKASALKMCFAAYTKGSTALLCAILGAAESLGVREELETQWSRNGSDFAVTTQNRVRQVTSKAWRFSGEMDEIAATFHSVDLPDGFHKAAAEIYRRISYLKDEPETPSLDVVLSSINKE